MEKVFAGLTAGFLALSAVWFAGTRQGAEPYRVTVEHAAPGVTAEVPTRVTGGEKAPAKVNINTATAAQLETLPGIGEKRADDIVADREANGPFRYPEDLTRVKGIGEGTLAGLLDYITVE